MVELYPLVDGGPVPEEWSYDLYEIVKDQRAEALSRVDRIRNANDDLPLMYTNGNAEEMLDPRVSALFAEDVSAFPRTVIISSEYDYLRYQDELFAMRLQDSLSRLRPRLLRDVRRDASGRGRLPRHLRGACEDLGARRGGLLDE